VNRNHFGINFDEGLPLVSPEDFEQLYVDCFSESKSILVDWLNESYQPLMFGGQIGSGKSTLIYKALEETQLTPHIKLHFDRETVNLDDGDFWGITLAGFINAGLEVGRDLSFCSLPQELGGYPASDWKALATGLCPQEFSIEAFSQKVALRKKVAEFARSGYIEQVVNEIAKRIQESLDRPLFIIAAGLDKFEAASASYVAMKDVVLTLSSYKTLFEVNAVYLFMQNPMFASADRLIITTVSHHSIVEMMNRRLGAYASSQIEQIEILAAWSGGNPRQALRLLTHYLTAKRHGKRNVAESISIAIRNTAGDYFSYLPRPSNDLMRTIQKAGNIASALISLPNDKDTARRALYGNWILISGMGNGVGWPVVVNPLVKEAFCSMETVETSETSALKAYSQAHDMSAHGLGLSRIDEKTGEEKTADQLLGEMLLSGLEMSVHTNITELLNILSAALLSRDRADRTIIAYKDYEFLAAVRAYLFARANTYEFQRCSHYQLEGGNGKQPVEKLEEILSLDTDVISIEFTGIWNEHQLQILDKLRDNFMEHQMLWWIPLDGLKEYLPHWTQLRQLFEVFVLEDELLGSIALEEVEADLAFFEDLVETEPSAESNVVNNMKVVLDYLLKNRGGEQNG